MSPVLSPELLEQLHSDAGRRAKEAARAAVRGRVRAEKRAVHRQAIEDLHELEHEHATALAWYANLPETARALVRATLEPALPSRLRKRARQAAQSRNDYADELRYRCALAEHVADLHALMLEAGELVPPRSSSAGHRAELMLAAGLRPGPAWVLLDDQGAVVAVSRRRPPPVGWHAVGELRGDETAEQLAVRLRAACRKPTTG